MSAPSLESITVDPASFRDPAGYVYRERGGLRRMVTKIGRDSYQAARDSGLHRALHQSGKLVDHTELSEGPDGGLILAPTTLPFISYPYEWTFGQLKEAATLTLDVLLEALERGFWLKDASGFNVQFKGTKPVFIDTLSFEPLVEGSGWPGYNQFIKHFLGPLALMSFTDRRLSTLLADNIDGLPLDFVSKLLPKHTWLSLGLLIHVHAHARAQRRFADSPGAKKRSVSRESLTNLITHLKGTISSLKPPARSGHWAEYVQNTNYSDDSQATKRNIIAQILEERRPSSVIDLGANTGDFSRIAAKYSKLVISVENDRATADLNYEICRREGTSNILTLAVDVTNPTPAVGWNGRERASFLDRGQSEVVLALALIHHLAIANNVPLPNIINVLGDLGRMVVVEFVPKSDSQVQRMLNSREDIFPHYSEEDFITAARARFSIKDTIRLPGSARSLFILENNNA